MQGVTRRIDAATVSFAAIVACAPLGAPPVVPRVAPLPAPVPASARSDSSSQIPPGTLRARIDALLRKPEFRTGEWSVLAVNPATGDTLYSHNAGLLMVPASNMKLVTSSVALTTLGPDFRVTTTFATHGRLANGVLDGDLVVTGRGDPTLSDHVRGSARAAMDSLADSLVARGIHSITGHIYSGADNFPGAHVGSGWDWEDLNESYGAGVDELLFNEGVARIVLRTGDGDSLVTAAPAVEPALNYLDELALALNANGVSTGLGVAESVLPMDDIPLDTIFVVRSAPLSEILPDMLKPSQNQIGEVLLRTIGLERTGVGIADSGIAVASRQLTDWGITADDYELHDGSGLARMDLISAEAIVRILARMQSSPNFPTFYNALPIAGVDGTLEYRMRRTRAANNVHAKTGSMHWVRSLSGYVTDRDGARLIFSIIANKTTARPDVINATVDSIAIALASYRK
jgi:D-alanyl-D-alanine carboxypeptidase/D-alanyl-D-alanine-endopeptidase (penicillin-binding protein 4)